MALLLAPRCRGVRHALRRKVVYRDPNMDFGSLQAVAVMPFTNLTRDNAAGERVRDVFMTMLQATGGVYVIPPGEVATGDFPAEPRTPGSPTAEEVTKFAKIVNADAVFTGTVTEYGEVRSGTSTGERRLLEPPDDGGADGEGGLERILHQGGSHDVGPPFRRAAGSR